MKNERTAVVSAQPKKSGQQYRKNGIVRFFEPYKKNYDIFLLFVPVLLWYLIFCYLPMYGIVIAFQDFKLADGILGSQWIGFENFKKLFRSPSFLRVFRNSVEISLLRIIFGFPLPILLALMLNEVRNKAFKKVSQTISYLPHFLSWVVLAGVFTQILSPSTGIVNRLLNAIGIESIYFMGDPQWFRFTLIATGIWQSVGWGSIIYIAAITSIDSQMYEAAVIDGANRFQQIIKITLPSIAPVITIQLILTSGSIINAGFDQIFNMYNDSVMKVSDIIDTFVYRKGLAEMQFSFSTAVGLFKNVISFAMVIITNAISKRVNDNGIW
ncbi:MAG: ABC transporter permease subunit [Firmicutes bacterium]|nr:ABC transporter permease subunit [Bacillota bacterium]